MLKRKPVIEKEVKPEIKGYSCTDDCTEYKANQSSSSGCGYVHTCKLICAW